jgi:hypothetical protein
MPLLIQALSLNTILTSSSALVVCKTNPFAFSTLLCVVIFPAHTFALSSSPLKNTTNAKLV